MLTIDAAVKSYRSGPTIGPISRVLKPGIYGLVWPNGVGKTTLLKLLATALTPTSGALEFAGIRPWSDRRNTHAYRRILGYMPQEVSLARGVRVGDYLHYAALLKELPRAEVSSEVGRVLELVDLTNRRRSWLRQLSGGMRRRVALAQALLGAPRVVLLDEPTADLDPEQRLRFRAALATLADDAVVVVSSHQIEDLAASCPEVLVMREGAFAFQGRPEQLAGLPMGGCGRASYRMSALSSR